MVTQQLQNFARQSIFDALSALFLHPAEPDTLPRLLDAMNAASGLANELGVDPTPFEALANSALSSSRDLAAEYLVLFVDDSSLALTETAWTPIDPSGLPVAQLKCRQVYIDAGLETAGLIGIAEDHLALQLAFTAVLILKEDLKGAATFFDQHLANWLPSFIEALLQRDDALLYKEVAHVLEAVCEIEKEFR